MHFENGIRYIKFWIQNTFIAQFLLWGHNELAKLDWCPDFESFNTSASRFYLSSSSDFKALRFHHDLAVVKENIRFQLREIPIFRRNNSDVNFFHVHHSSSQILVPFSFLAYMLQRNWKVSTQSLGYQIFVYSYLVVGL